MDWWYSRPEVDKDLSLQAALVCSSQTSVLLCYWWSQVNSSVHRYLHNWAELVVVVANLMHQGSTVSQYGEGHQPAQKKKYWLQLSETDITDQLWKKKKLFTINITIYWDSINECVWNPLIQHPWDYTGARLTNNTYNDLSP